MDCSLWLLAHRKMAAHQMTISHFGLESHDASAFQKVELAASTRRSGQFRQSVAL
jgi:hypothetical protein